MKRPYELRPAVRRQQREQAMRLVARVAALTGAEMADIVGPATSPELFRLRAASAWLIRRIDYLSYPEISRVLGRRTECHANHLVRRAEQLRGMEWPLRLLTDRILGESK